MDQNNIWAVAHALELLQRTAAEYIHVESMLQNFCLPTGRMLRVGEFMRFLS